MHARSVGNIIDNLLRVDIDYHNVGGPGNIQPPGCAVHSQVVPRAFAAQLQLFDYVISRIRSIGNRTDKETAKQ